MRSEHRSNHVFLYIPLFCNMPKITTDKFSETADVATGEKGAFFVLPREAYVFPYFPLSE